MVQYLIAILLGAIGAIFIAIGKAVPDNKIFLIIGGIFEFIGGMILLISGFSNLCYSIGYYSAQ